MTWIKDEDFIRGEVPMTKFIKRAAIMAMMDVSKNDYILEIGSGTGSCSVQMSKLGARVKSLECNKKAYFLSIANYKKFNSDVDIIYGKAPENITEDSYNKCYIGGSKGSLEDILQRISDIKSIKCICATFIIMDNAFKFIEYLKQYSYSNIDTKLINVSNLNDIGMMISENPILIVKGERL